MTHKQLTKEYKSGRLAEVMGGHQWIGKIKNLEIYIRIEGPSGSRKPSAVMVAVKAIERFCGRAKS